MMPKDTNARGTIFGGVILSYIDQAAAIEAHRQFDQNFVMAFVYNTNSIEGSTLSPKEVELLLSENISPNKPLDDVLEANFAASAFWGSIGIAVSYFIRLATMRISSPIPLGMM